MKYIQRLITLLLFSGISASLTASDDTVSGPTNLDSKSAQTNIAKPSEWMPSPEDFTQLSWTSGPPYISKVQFKPKESTLSFRLGNSEFLFDAARVRPVGQDWDCAIVRGSERFVCTGYKEQKDSFLQPVRFVESGRFFQRVIIDGLRFVNEKGEELPGNSRMEITAWPDRLAFRLESDSDGRLEMKYGDKTASGEKSIRLEVAGNNSSQPGVTSDLPVVYDPDLACYTMALPEKPWSNEKRTYYPEEHLDRLDRWKLSLTNESDKPTVARLMFTQKNNLPITGFVPMLCNPDGTPTGLTVQISKNWHRRPEKGSIPHEGNWFHGFAFVRIPPHSKRDFLFQMVYARYGGIFSASHAQLSLIGYSHNQFWDQAAIGSFGENICFEPGRIQRRCFIVDIRPLMTLSVKEDKPWGWAKNSGGGDFLMWEDTQGKYQVLKSTRTDYRAYGPCLTDVGYSEETEGGEIAAKMDVSIARSEDYLRAFLRIRYDVRKPIRWSRLAFFQLGSDFYNKTPFQRIAFGDLKGINQEWKMDSPERPSAFDLLGDQPWVSLHGFDPASATPGSAATSRGLIVRSWNATLGGKPALPRISLVPKGMDGNEKRTVVELIPPEAVTELLPGDHIEADLELVFFPTDAWAYYGPDSTFREALQNDADTWRLVHREASGNALAPKVARGNIQKNYPVVVALDAEQRAEFSITGGIGCLPITLTGLKEPNGFRLLCNGNPVSHWQTDWDPITQRWKISFNIPVCSGSPLQIEFGKNTIPSP